MNEKNKTILFWVITLMLPLFLLLLAEGALRVGGYEREKQELFVEAPNTPDYLMANAKFVRRYFPVFIPEIAPNVFRKEKLPNTFRVFVFGGSSTEGFPYNFYNSFADQLEQKLLLSAQGRHIEVINLGMTAVNSYVIRDLSKRVLPYQPDAVIIYAGHNEFYGSFGAATTQFGFTDSIRLKHLILWLKNWRLYQVLEQLLEIGKGDGDGGSGSSDGVAGGASGSGNAAGTTGGAVGEQRTMMAKVIRESDIPLESDLFERGMRQYQTNLEDVISVFQKSSVPVYIGTLASNLKDQPPLTENPLAHETYERAMDHFAMGRGDEALQGFTEAKELDGTRFRAPSRLNEMIRELGDQRGVILVDTQQVLRQQSESGIEDNSLFIDHLHPNDIGHKLMASTFFGALTDHPKLASTITENTARPPQAISTFEKAYAEVSIARLLVGYPFQKNVGMQEELAAFEEIYQSYLSESYIDSIAAVASKEQVFIPMALTEVVAMARQKKDTMAVVSHSYDLLKWQLRSLNLIESTIEYTLNSGEKEGYLINVLHQVLNDGNYDPRYVDLLASLYLLEENTEQAGYWLRETERLAPNTPRLLYNYSRYHLLQGDSLKAQEYYRRFLGTQTRRQ
jgi:tetratricopeptide (TPR) repeat protein